MIWLWIATILLPTAATILLPTALFGQAVGAENSGKGRSRVLTIPIEGAPITPVTARFIARAIQHAEETKAQCVVIVLDTPGGLVDSTREIVKVILHSRIPMVVYVAPPGARAASAGLFITMAGHIAAMAPGTNIGAAHPVQIGGLPGRPGEQPEPANESKNDNSRSSTALQLKIRSSMIRPLGLGR